MKSLLQKTGVSILILSLLPLWTFAELPQGAEEAQERLLERKAALEERIEARKAASGFSTEEIVVKYKNDTEQFRTVKIPAGASVAQTLALYRGKADVAYAEPNYIAYANYVPDDTYYSYQWHLNNNPMDSDINTEQAWDITMGSNNVVVAVIDTGVAYETARHGRYRYYQAPDLTDTCFVPGYDFINNDPWANDDEGHGTHVAGTIAQSTNNGTGVAGVAPDTCIMPVKALNSSGSGTYTQIANAIYHAVDNGAHIINMSLGGSIGAQVLEDAVAYAYANDVTVIAAAGNENTSAPHYPSSYNEYVISVGATDYNADRAYYSNFGADVDIAAPGGDVYADANGDGFGDGVLQQTLDGSLSQFGYIFYQGTSMAAPHAAGTAALLMAHGNATNPDDIREALVSTARDIGDPSLGAGLIDASLALAWTSGPVPNTAPVAEAGADQVVADADNTGTEMITLDGSNSHDPDGTITSYEWSDGVSVLGTNVIETIPLPTGSHTITLTVADNEGASDTDTVVVTVNPNTAPTANAGSDQTVMDVDDSGTELVTLNGSASNDPDGSIVSYLWTEGATTLGSTASISPEFSVGTHTITLTVTDNGGRSASDEVIVTITEYTNLPPVAEAGPDQSAFVGDTVLFDGTDSIDPDGTIVSYAWDFGDGNNGSGASPAHSYATADTYTISLTITDNKGLTDTDTLAVTVSEEPSEIEVFYDSFEVSEWNGLWTEDSQRDWVRKTQRATDGVYSAEVDGYANDAALTSINIDLGGKTAATITFDWLIERTLDTGEYLSFHVSTDGGVSWTEHRRLRGNVDAEHTWHRNETVEVSGVSQVRLEFRGKMSASAEDANVDNVRVVAH